MFGHYLNRNALEAIANYQYKAGNYTWLDNKLNYWWNWASKFIPDRMAANTLTLIGFLCSVTAYAPTAYYSPEWAEPLPRWVSWTVVLAVFGYQTFDALDGKHARRTGSSSPLGTLFDHGCDVITATILTVTVICIARAGHNFGSFLVLVLSAHLTQFLYLWWEYHFGIFHSNPGYAGGVSEAQFIVIGAAASTAIFGSDFFLTNLVLFLPKSVQNFLPVQSLPLNTFLMWIVAINNLLAGIYMVRNGAQQLQGRQRRRAVFQVFCFSIFLVMEWLLYSTARTYGLNTFIMTMLMLTAYAIMCIRMLLSSTGQLELNTLSFVQRYYHSIQWPTLPFIMLSVLAVLAQQVRFRKFREHYCSIAYGVLLWQIVYLTDMVITAISDICKRLEIRCFQNKPITKIGITSQASLGRTETATQSQVTANSAVGPDTLNPNREAARHAETSQSALRQRRSHRKK